MEPCQNTEKLDAGASDDKAKEIEHDTAAQSIKCCDRPSQEKSSCVPTADVEQGFERPPDPGRRETFAQKVRNRFRSEHDVMRDVPPLKEQTLDDLPWGYPRLAGFVNIDTNTHLYRRFGYLRNRTLLYVQDELVHLERKLEAMDAADAADEPYRLASRSWDEENDPKRKILMGEIKAKLKEYDDLLIREETILKMEAPSQKLHQHYRNYMWFEKPLCPEDAEFVYHKDDMVNLHGYTESNWIKPMVDSLMMALPPSVMKVLFRKRNGEASGATDQYQIQDTRLEFVAKLTVLLLSMLLLLLPVALLYILQVSAWSKLGIIFAFTALFTTITLYLTRAKQLEVFVALATYCAVLVVFLGNLPPP